MQTTSIRTKVIEETKEYNNGNGFFSIEYVPIKGKNAGRMIRSLYKDNNLIIKRISNSSIELTFTNNHGEIYYIPLEF